MALSELGQSFIGKKAEALASNAYISGNDAQMLLDYYGLTRSENRYASWDNFKDKKILDIGSGISNFVAKLIARGADAYALDYGYKNMDQFLMRLNGGWKAGKDFLGSIEQNPQRYIFGSAHNLPFEDNTFDAITSFYGIFGVIDKDKELAKASILEAIRVLKPNGILQIGPVLGTDFSEIQKANQKEVMESLLERENILIDVRSPRGLRMMASFGHTSDMGKLTIVKLPEN